MKTFKTATTSFISICMTTLLGLASPATAASQTMEDTLREQPCHPFSVGTCGMPYPSNYYSAEDKTSPTGRRLFMPNSIFPADTFSNDPKPVIRDGSLYTAPEYAISGLSGFSALTPVLFEAPVDLDRLSLPHDGGHSLIVFDRLSGERMPVMADVSQVAETMDLRNHRRAKNTILQAFPRGRWAFGHSYVAVITSTLKYRNGHSVQPLLAVRSALEKGLGYPESTANFLIARGLNISEVVSYTEFTVRDEQSLVQNTKDFLGDIAEKKFGIKITEVEYSTRKAHAAVVKGLIEVPQFDGVDGRVEFKAGAAFRREWLPFRLMLPHAANTKSVPLALVSHGQGLFKEFPMTFSAPALLKRGIAAFFIDLPLHGQRLFIDEDGNVKNLMGIEEYFLFDFRNPKKSLAVAGSAHQTLVDYYTVFNTLKEALPTLDVLPRREGNALSRRRNHIPDNGDGFADVDVTRTFYQSSSLGTVYGVAFSALAPGLKGAWLESGGGGIASTLNNSILFRQFYFHRAIPKGLSAGDAALFLNIALHTVDACDGLNYAHYFKAPLPPLAPRALALHFNIGDTVMPIHSTAALAAAAGLPHVEFAGLEASSGQLPPQIAFLGASDSRFQKGYGVFHNQTKPRYLDWNLGWAVDDLLYHATKPNAQYYDHWLENVVFAP